jgi:hypothetical protein
VLVRRDGRFLSRVGDPKEPVWDDPYNVLFRDPETIENTFRFIDGRPPQGVSQGDRQVMLFLLRDDVVLGTVKEDPRGSLEMFTLRKQLAEELRSVFAGVDLDG